MTDKFNQLKAKIDAELELQRRQKTESPAFRARKLGLFIQASMKNLGKSQADFESFLDIDADLAEAILSGMLPGTELDRLLLSDIAEFLNHDVHKLLSLLGHEAQFEEEEVKAYRKTKKE